MATNDPITGVLTRAPTLPASNRRRFLGALAFAPIVTLPAVASSTAPANIAHLEQLFAQWKTALWAINHNDDPADDEGDSPNWRRLNLAGDEIVRSDVTSPRAAAIRLWIGLEHVTTSAVESDAIAAEDMVALEPFVPNYDWEVTCIVQALRALAGGER